MNRTSARPLALVYVAVVVYASLYPFSDWRDQGIAPWAFLVADVPRYWTAFDIVANVLGYFPLGVLLALSVLRGGRAGRTRWQALAIAASLGIGLSMLLESAQSYLPERVPSNLDFVLNVSGTLLGAALACGLDRLGLTDRWSQFRNRWFVPDSHGALVLLALWPIALLFPAAVPMGLGRVLERLESTLATWLQDTPFLSWIPVREVEFQPLVPGVEMLCVALGLMAPCLLVYCVVAPALRRIAMALMLAATGVSGSALSAALSYGPTHAWAWLSLPAQAGLAIALAASLMMAGIPVRLCRALLLIMLTMHLVLVNQAPESAYFAQTLQAWEQGRFIRFHGLIQWLGWLWPFAAMAYLLGRVWRRERLESDAFPRNG